MKTLVIRYSSIVIFLLLACGCQKRVITPAPPPTPGSAVPSVSAPQAVTPSDTEIPLQAQEEEPPPEIAAIPEDLREGRESFEAGSYKRASLSFEKFLAANPKSEDRELALFYLGLSRTIATDSSRDLVQAEAALRRLIVEFPKSRYRKQAEYLLGLQSQIEKLKADVKERDEKIRLLEDELKKLKEIDLQRRSRPGE